ADFPHPALASGGDAQTARGIRMADMGRRKPSADEPLHTLPLDTSLLAPSFERVMPEVTDRKAEVSQCVPVARYSEVSDMPTYNGLQPLADFWNRIMHTPPQLDLDPLQRRLHTLANRLPKHHKPALPRLPADVLEAEEIEGLWLAQTSALSVGRRVASELKKSRP
ncbi:MAG: hypothetical protein WCC24_02725, partial [Terracidiphilus sp.]